MPKSYEQLTASQQRNYDHAVEFARLGNALMDAKLSLLSEVAETINLDATKASFFVDVQNAGFDNCEINDKLAVIENCDKKSKDMLSYADALMPSRNVFDDQTPPPQEADVSFKSIYKSPHPK